MRKCLLIFIVTKCLQLGLVQFIDDFMDGDFTNNSVFTFDVNLYDINLSLFHNLSDTINGKLESYKKVVVLHY